MSEQGYWVLLTEAEWRDLQQHVTGDWKARIEGILEPDEVRTARNAARPVGSDKDGRMPTANSVINGSKRRGTKRTKLNARTT